jgi:hypothetical protein
MRCLWIAWVHAAFSLVSDPIGTPDDTAMQGKQLVFVTNNSTKSRKGYLGKFTGLGLNVKAVRGTTANSTRWLHGIGWLQILWDMQGQCLSALPFTLPKACLMSTTALVLVIAVIRDSVSCHDCRRRSTRLPTPLPPTWSRSSSPRTRRCTWWGRSASRWVLAHAGWFPGWESWVSCFQTGTVG